jgi:hypothetical protein
MTKHKVTGSYDSATGVLQLVFTPVSALASIPILNIVLLVLIIIYWKSILTVLASLFAFSLVFIIIKIYNDDYDGVDKPWKNRLLVYALIIGSIGTPYGWLMNKLHGESEPKPKTEESAPTQTQSGSSNSNNDPSAQYTTSTPSDTATTAEGDTAVSQTLLEADPEKDTAIYNKSPEPEEVMTHSGSPEYVSSSTSTVDESPKEEPETTYTTTSRISKTITRIIPPDAKTDYRFYVAIAVFVLGLVTVLWTTLGSLFKKKEPKPSISKSLVPQPKAPSASNLQENQTSLEVPNAREMRKPQSQAQPTASSKNETQLYQRHADGFYELEFLPALTPAQIATLRGKIQSIREHTISVGNGKFKTLKTKILDNGTRLVSVSHNDLSKVKGFVKELDYSVGNKVRKI